MAILGGLEYQPLIAQGHYADGTPRCTMTYTHPTSGATYRLNLDLVPEQCIEYLHKYIKNNFRRSLNLLLEDERRWGLEIMLELVRENTNGDASSGTHKRNANSDEC